jgi:hypothetical protein
MTERTQQTTREEDAGFDETASEQPTSREAGSETGREQIRQDDRPDGSDSGAAQAPTGSAETGDDRAPLFAADDADRYRQRWESLQARFVDQPRETVAEADNLVSEVMQQLTAGFSDRRSSLEAQFEQGDQVSTEELRVTLTRYRSFFNRLLSV